jgi:tetratricopeptide (TPR) repeat protein
LADALNSTGRPEEAIPHFAALTRLQADNPDAWYGLGTAYTLSSRRSFGEIERTAPESGYWYALLARSRAEQNEFRSALYLYKQALGKLPDLLEAHAALAPIYRQNQHDHFEPKLKRTVSFQRFCN